MAKFNETSDILDKIDWEDPNNAYLIYSMLKKILTTLLVLTFLQKKNLTTAKLNMNILVLMKRTMTVIMMG